MHYNMTSQPRSRAGVKCSYEFRLSSEMASAFYWLVRYVQSDGLMTSTLCPLSPICVFKSAIVPFIKFHFRAKIIVLRITVYFTILYHYQLYSC